VLFGELDALRRVGGSSAALAPAGVAPYVVAVAGLAAAAVPDPLAALERARKARYGSASPGAPRARLAWSTAYATVGVVGLPRDPAFAVRALRISAALDPGRSTAWTNLGVALEAKGELDEAMTCARRALELEPSRPTPWVNLARLQLRIGRPDAARQLLRMAQDAGVRDERLDELSARLRD
jgi:tetratricopeptide (TPR) repeat protein